MKRTPMRAVSDRRRKRDAIYPERRREVWARAEGMCEFCRGRPVMAIHHIAGRGGPDPHRLDNLVGLCASVGSVVGCHERAHGNPEWAVEVGLMRSRHQSGPE